MFPIGDDNQPNRGPAILTLALVAVNVLVFLYEATLDPQQLQDFVTTYGVIPIEIQIKYSDRYGIPETEERFYNYSSAAGLNYIVDVSKPAGDRITINSLSDGKLFYPDSIYLTAINSYRGSGGGGHLTRGAEIPLEDLPGRIVSSTEKEFRHSMIQWIEENKIITPEIISSWRVVPEDWWKKGKEKDYQILFK